MKYNTNITHNFAMYIKKFIFLKKILDEKPID